MAEIGERCGWGVIDDLADRGLRFLAGDRDMHSPHVFSHDAKEDHPNPAEHELRDHQGCPAGDRRLEVVRVDQAIKDDDDPEQASEKP
jgi:hypothetical protein